MKKVILSSIFFGMLFTTFCSNEKMAVNSVEM